MVDREVVSLQEHRLKAELLALSKIIKSGEATDPLASLNEIVERHGVTQAQAFNLMWVGPALKPL